MSHHRLNGELPTELGNLSELTVLALQNNRLSDSIPAELGNLTNLTDLVLSNNQLSGSIPAELGNLASLTDLALGDNQLSGSIPSELGSISTLVRLYLNDNSLTGPLPSELANLNNLRRLALKNNNGVCIPDAQAVDVDFRIWASWLENWHTLSEGVLTCDGNVFERAPQNVDPVEFKALVALYEATDGPNWTNNTNWLSGAQIGRLARHRDRFQ